MVRPDGRLSHDLLPGEKGPQDACGVFGVWAPGEDVAKLAYYGLYALQHRGQESAGIAASDGRRIAVYKDMGLVSQVFDEATLTTLTGHLAVGHCRYSTTGGSHWANAQPTLGATPHGTVALAHNGNLTNSAELYERLIDKSGFPAQGELAQGNTTDTALVTALLAEHPHGSLEEAAMHLLPQLVGSFCLAFMDEHALYAARDPQGIRPLVLGRLERGWVVASETAALDIVGASLVREIEPGEFVAIDEHGLRSHRFAETRRAACVFEYVYLARPDTTINGRSVYESRVEMGRRLAREHRVEADLVMPTPESGTPAAIGYAEESGIPFGNGLVKNAYVGRTFIQPSDTIRQLGIRLKLNPLRSVVAGRRLIVIDDSIVRGNTQRALIRMLREAGAAEIHVRISSPPIKWPCFYGIDFASRAELIANGLGVEEIRASLGADSLGYISEDGMVAATQQERGELCTACFSGTYPTRLPDADRLGKNVFEAREPVDSSPRRAHPHLRRGPGLPGHLHGLRPRTGLRPRGPDPARGPGPRRARARDRPPARDREGRLTMAQPPSPTDRTVTYASAGVDVEAGDRAVELMKDAVRATHTPNVVGGVGGFAGLLDVSELTGYRRPYLATSTDGVGTKVAIAQTLDVHDTIGWDLVGMVVDDIVVVGAKPLFMTDYIATGRVVPERIADIVRGIAAACEHAGTALVGGETAEHPGLLRPDEYDVAGAATGVVEADELLGPDRVRAGDVVIGMASSGLHSNGYSLVRKVVNVAGWSLDRQVSELGRTLGEELLEPTRVYAADVLDLAAAFPVNGPDRTTGHGVRGFSHVTGGGLAANLARVLPPGLEATVDRSTWELPAVFQLISQLGNVPPADLERTLNLGVGMVAIVDPAVADDAVAHLTARGLSSWVMGTVGRIDPDADHSGPDWVQGAKGVAGGVVRMVGAYAG